jgi:hypothetical protein
MKNCTISRFQQKLALFGAAVCVLGLLSGCGKPKATEEKKPEPAPAATTNSSVKPKAPIVDEAYAAMFATPQDPATMSEADKALLELRKTLQALSAIPEQWQTNEAEPTKEEMERFEKQMGQSAGAAADKAKDFYTRFPTNEFAEMARQQELDLLQAAVQLGATNRQAQLDALETALMNDPKISEDGKIELRLMQLQRRVTARESEGEAATLGQFEVELRALQKDFPKRSEFPQMLLGVAEEWMSRGETNKAQTIAREIIAGDAEKDVKDAATEFLKAPAPTPEL